jgi:hypothetical protein
MLTMANLNLTGLCSLLGRYGAFPSGARATRLPNVSPRCAFRYRTMYPFAWYAAKERLMNMQKKSPNYSSYLWIVPNGV